MPNGVDIWVTISIDSEPLDAISSYAALEGGSGSAGSAPPAGTTRDPYRLASHRSLRDSGRSVQSQEAYSPPWAKAGNTPTETAGAKRQKIYPRAVSGWSPRNPRRPHAQPSLRSE